MKVYLALVAKNGDLDLPNVLKQAADAADIKNHVIVEKPEDADVIVINNGDGFYGENLRVHPLVRRFPEKAYVYSESDAFLPFLPGVYASAKRGLFSVGRVRSYCYISSLFDCRNPFITPAHEQRDLLFSFLGSSSCLLRKRLYSIKWNRDDVHVEDTFGYRHWDAAQTDRAEWQQRFADVTARSRFVLCPRGSGAGSMRLFEVMERGVAPVIISDGFVLPAHVNWSACAVRVAERDIKRLPQILGRFTPEEAREMGKQARREWEAHFAPEKQFNAVVAACEAIAAGRRGLPPERAYQRIAWPLLIARRAVWEWGYGTARGIVLQAYKLRGKPLPFKRRVYEE